LPLFTELPRRLVFPETQGLDDSSGSVARCSITTGSEMQCYDRYLAVGGHVAPLPVVVLAVGRKENRDYRRREQQAEQHRTVEYFGGNFDDSV
jgi:hypothetical protein